MINKDIINVKNILKIVISILVIASMFKSCAQAVTYEELQDYVNYTADYYSQNTYYQNIKNIVNNNENFVIGLQNGTIPIENYDNILIYYVSSGSRVYYTIEMYDVTSWSLSSNGIRYNGVYRTAGFSNGNWGPPSSEKISYANSHVLSYCYSRTANDYNNLQGMNYTIERLEGNYQLPSTYVGMQAVPEYTFLTYDNYLNDYTTVNNFTTYFLKNDLYGASSYMIGTVHPYDSYYYEIRLRNYNSNQVVGEVFASEDPFNPYNADSLYLNEQHQLSVKSLYLKYNTQYELEITSYYGDGGSNFEVLKKYYIFFPTNAEISGDTILSFGSGDYTIQDNSVQVISSIDNQTSIFENLYNQMLTPSGDKIKAKLEETLEAMQMPSRRDRNGNSRLRRYK